MAGYVCTIASGKGGAGKTTTAVNLAAVFGAEGYDVVVVDADLAMANLGEMLGLEHGASIHDVLAGDAAVEDATVEAKGMDVVPGDRDLEAFADADPAELRTVIDALRESYDLVLVDTGAGLSHETTVPLGLADGVLLVTTPEEVSVLDTIKTADLVDRVDGDVVGGLVTRVTRTGDVGSLDGEFEFPILGAVPLALDTDEPVVRTSPESDAAAAYRALVDPLSRIFFDGADGADVDPAFDESWFGDATDSDAGDTEPDDTEDEQEDSADADGGEDGSDDDDDSSVGWGGLFTG